jgi:DNA polymerase elongation subunit (family B)
VVQSCRDYIENKTENKHDFNLQMISIDTDSCTFQLDKEKHTNYQIINQFQDQINKHIAKEIGPCFKFAHEEIIKSVILLGNKSYMWQYYDEKIMTEFTNDC